MKAGLLIFSWALLGISCHGAIFTVTTTNDSGAGSLRQALADANSSPGVDTITFQTTGVIRLSSTLVPLTEGVVISGPGTNLLTIHGNNTARVFLFSQTSTSSVSGLKIANALATGYANGAAIANEGKLTISNCFFLNNTNQGGWGGAVFNSGILQVSGCSFVSNNVTGAEGEAAYYWGCSSGGGGGGAGMGGGIFSKSGRVRIEGCVFTANSAIGGKGGIGDIGGCGRGGGVYGGLGSTSINGPAGGLGGFGSGGGGGNRYYGAGDGGFGGGGGGTSVAQVGQGGYGGGMGGKHSYYGVGGGGGGIGGGVFQDTGDLKLVGCTFERNVALGGLRGDWVGPTFPEIYPQNGQGIGPDFFNRAGTVGPEIYVSTPGGGTTQVTPITPPYLSNSWVSVEARASEGWQFMSWIGDIVGTNPRVDLIVPRDFYAQAIFGTSLTNSELMEIYPKFDSYAYGTAVRATAFPPPGTYFVSWTGYLSGTNNPAVFYVTNPNPVISFNLAALPVGRASLTVVPDGNGRVSLNPYANTYQKGETITLTAIPDEGQDFLGWGGPMTGTQNPAVLILDQSKTVSAYFTKRPRLRVGTEYEGWRENGFRLTFQSELRTRYSIQASTNFSNWVPLGSFYNAIGVAQFFDGTAKNWPFRFYRAVEE